VNEYENANVNVSITVSSEDVIGAYKEQVSRLSEENALLNAQVRKLVRDRQLGVTDRLGVVREVSDLDAWNDVEIPPKREILS
jgi:hypothetical protein